MTSKFKIILVFIILVCILLIAKNGIINYDKKIIYAVIVFSLLMMMPFVVSKIGLFPFFCGLIFIYWVPLNMGFTYFSGIFKYLYPTELGMWALLAGALIHNRVFPDSQLKNALKRFSFFPFLLFIGGAIMTYFMTKNNSIYASTYAPSNIRVLCILPAIICFLCVYFIKTVKQAERALWIFLISAGFLGLFYIYVPSIDPRGLTYQIQGVSSLYSDRIIRIIELPLFGSFRMNAETTPIYFAIAGVLSFNIWLNKKSFKECLLPFILSVISCLVIINGQGRGGMIAMLISVAGVIIANFIFGKHSMRSKNSILLKSTIFPLFFLGSFWFFLAILPAKGLGSRVLNPIVVSDALSNRIRLWQNAFDLFLDHPFFGVGLYGVPAGPNFSGITWAAHNMYLYLLLSFGIVGFIGFCWILLYHVKQCVSGLRCKDKEYRILCSGGVGCFLAFFVGGIGSCVFITPWQVCSVWIPLGITMAAATLKKEGNSV